MRSWKFPHMLNTNSSRIWTSDKYLEQTKQNTAVLLKCEKGELFCDPYFGIKLKHFIFDQNNKILRDALTDEIYNQIALLVPQLRVTRNDIEIFTGAEKGKVYINIHGINQIDFQPNSLQLVLFENDENTL